MIHLQLLELSIEANKLLDGVTERVLNRVFVLFFTHRSLPPVLESMSQILANQTLKEKYDLLKLGYILLRMI